MSKGLLGGVLENVVLQRRLETDVVFSVTVGHHILLLVGSAKVMMSKQLIGGALENVLLQERQDAAFSSSCLEDLFLAKTKRCLETAVAASTPGAPASSLGSSQVLTC